MFFQLRAAICLICTVVVITNQFSHAHYECSLINRDHKISHLLEIRRRLHGIKKRQRVVTATHQVLITSANYLQTPLNILAAQTVYQLIVYLFLRELNFCFLTPSYYRQEQKTFFFAITISPMFQHIHNNLFHVAFTRDI